MRQLFEVDPDNDGLGNAQPLSAVWPKYEAPVVRQNSDRQRELVKMSWGFLTKKVSKKTGKPISPAAWNNARADKVRTNGLWRRSFEERRCLVPATSFREAKGQRPATDYWFALKGDEQRPLFAFAGMWTMAQEELRREDSDGLTHTIITTTANELVQPIHPTRMPVILDQANYDTWLNGSADEAADLLAPYPADKMGIVLSGVGVLKDEG